MAKMRRVEHIIIHCTDSDNPATTLADIRQWHKQRGFADIGYHWVIWKDGRIEKGRNESLVGAHTVFHNHNSIGICLHGIKEFEEIQRNSLCRLVWEKVSFYGLYPNDIFPHNYFTKAKTCPNFDIGFVRTYVRKQGELK